MTADRAIIYDSSGSVREVPLTNTPIERTRSRNGRHITVTFGPGTAVFGPGGRSMPANSGVDGIGSAYVQPRFYDIADVAGVEAALARIIAGHRGPAAGQDHRNDRATCSISVKVRIRSPGRPARAP